MVTESEGLLETTSISCRSIKLVNISHFYRKIRVDSTIPLSHGNTNKAHFCVLGLSVILFVTFSKQHLGKWSFFIVSTH